MASFHLNPEPEVWLDCSQDYAEHYAAELTALLGPPFTVHTYPNDSQAIMSWKCNR